MSFFEPEFADDRPAAFEFYSAGIVASYIVFLGCLAVISGTALLGESGSLTTALSIVLVGGFYGVFLTGILALLMIAPIGTAIGLALVRFAPPGYWQGPANGAATAAVVLGVYALVALPDGSLPDPTGIALAAGFVTIAATAGWMVQRWLLRWPVKPDDEV